MSAIFKYDKCSLNAIFKHAKCSLSAIFKQAKCSTSAVLHAVDKQQGRNSKCFPPPTAVPPLGAAVFSL